jgi:hypothetical protein
MKLINAVIVFVQSRKAARKERLAGQAYADVRVLMDDSYARQSQRRS